MFTTANIENAEEIIKKTCNNIPDLDRFTASICSENDIARQIQEIHSAIATVESAKIEIDNAQNYLVYENNHARGIMVNIKSTSLIALYNTISSKRPDCSI